MTMLSEDRDSPSFSGTTPNASRLPEEPLSIFLSFEKLTADRDVKATLSSNSAQLSEEQELVLFPG